MKHNCTLATFVLSILSCLSSAAGQESTKSQLLELTGGRRVKVTWALDKGALKFYDTKTDVIKTLPFKGGSNKPVLFTSDALYILATVGEEPGPRQVMAYNTETGKVIEYPKGPNNNLMAVWTDPKTKKTWIYVNSKGDRKESWRASAGPIYRIPFDEPKKRELFWDRTRSHLYLNFSADGARACFEPNWGNIGQVKFVYGPDGKPDQDKCTYQKFGGGCYPAMAPDNSYRLFRLSGRHNSIDMADADNKNPRSISVVGMLKPGGGRRNHPTAWLPFWSYDPQYMTIMAPEHDSELRGTSQIYIGRFNKEITKVEKWVRVSDPKEGKCRRSHAWVAPAK